MTEKIDAASWVYVIVQDPEKDEQIVGQDDAEADISYIPMFASKDAAMQGILHIAKEKGKKYEIQAIIYEDLERYASQGGFILFELDEAGKVIQKRAPQA